MAVEKVEHSAQVQGDDLRRQLFDALIQQGQINREKDTIDARVLALTNLVGGFDLGKRAGVESVKRLADDAGDPTLSPDYMNPNA